MNIEKQPPVPKGDYIVKAYEGVDPDLEIGALEKDISEIEWNPNHPKADSLAFLVAKLETLKSQREKAKNRKVQ